MTAPRTPYQMLFAALPIARREADRTALVLIDAQRTMTRREAGLGAEAQARGIEREFVDYFAQVDAALPNMRRLAEAARATGGLVVHSVITAGDGLSRHLQEGRMPLPSPGDPRAEIDEAVAPAPSDLVLPRRTYGAFSSGDLASRLKERTIDRVVLAGMPANISVAIAAREAADRDYDVLVVQDACASETSEWQFLTMLGLGGGAIRIVGTSDAVDILSGRRS